MKCSAAAFAFIVCACLSHSADAQTEVKNDGFTDGSSAGFQGGFVVGEIGAARFDLPTGSGPRLLRSVRYLFGGGTGERNITLHVWDDQGGLWSPGAELWSGDFTVTSSNSAWQEADLQMHNILLPGTFRIGIEFHHSGLPAMARDDDGSNNTGRNFIFISSGMWIDSTVVPLPGDWILRATLQDPAVDGGVAADAGGLTDAAVLPDAASVADAGLIPDPPDAALATDAAEPPDATVAPDAASAADAASPADASNPTADCQVNSDCAVGSHCDSNLGRCTFECRDDVDCAAGNQCNSLGECVAAATANPDDGNEAQACGCTNGNPLTPNLLAWGLLGAGTLLAIRRRGPRA